jgi:3-oxoacyl-[acyl-carrier-protein] synthase II
MPATKDSKGRPIVVVTGMGVVTSLGAGKEDNWAKLTAGHSGIRTISRFATDGLKTTMAGTVDFVAVEPYSSPALSERLADLVAEEAIDEAAIGSHGDFPGPLFLAVPPIEFEWPQRFELAEFVRDNEAIGYQDLLQVAATGRFAAMHGRFQLGSVANSLSNRFGTKGSPISLSTACASGATAIQLGVEAIRRNETEASLCIGTDGSVYPESLIRFSLLSALSTANEDPAAAAKPFSKNRDGFVMAEGAAAVVLESMEAALARGANILGVVEGCGEMADAFHRTRSSPDGKPIIGCIRNALSDAGLTPEDIDYINPHGERQNGMSRRYRSIRRARRQHSHLLQQVYDRPYLVCRRSGRGGLYIDDVAKLPHPADHQLQGTRSHHSARRGAKPSPRRHAASRGVELVRLRRAERFAGDGTGAALARARGRHDACSDPGRRPQA